MSREDLLAQLTPHRPSDPHFTDDDLNAAADFFTEICDKSYEQIAIILALQKKLVTGLLASIEKADKEQRASKLVNEALDKANNPPLIVRGFPLPPNRN